MGCCAIRIPKYQTRPLTCSSNTGCLASQREEILSKIFLLHKMILACNNQIEVYLINNAKDWAFLLKCKKFCIKKKSSVLQHFISRLDECLEYPEVNKEKINDVSTELKILQGEVSISLIFDSLVKLEDQTKEYIEELKETFKTYEVDEEAIRKELEYEMKEYRKSNDDSRNVIRRKYIKTRKSA